MKHLKKPGKHQQPDIASGAKIIGDKIEFDFGVLGCVELALLSPGILIVILISIVILGVGEFYFVSHEFRREA